MPEISDLSAVHQRTVRRLSRNKPVSVDRITGLVDRAKGDFFKEHPDVTAVDWSYDTTTINGSTLPGQLLPLENTVKVVDEIVGDQHISVLIGRRKAGTRVGIHVNEGEGAIFFVGGKGRITDFMEGFPDSIKSVGSYSYQPSGIPKSEANLTTKNIRLMNILIAPADEPSIIYLEPGFPGYNPPS